MKKEQRMSKKKQDEYSFCESVFAGPKSAWHLRKLTSVGRKLGGGIDTPFLCADKPGMGGWDLDVPLSDFHLVENTCKRCLVKYRELTDKEK